MKYTSGRTVCRWSLHFNLTAMPCVCLHISPCMIKSTSHASIAQCYRWIENYTSMLHLTKVIAFPTSLLHDCKLITLTTAFCIPRVKCNQTETCKQIDPNQHCIFERHTLMWWVLKYRLEASLFSFGSRFVQIVSPCLHIKGLQGQR